MDGRDEISWRARRSDPELFRSYSKAVDNAKEMPVRTGQMNWVMDIGIAAPTNASHALVLERPTVRAVAGVAVMQCPQGQRRCKVNAFVVGLAQ